MVKHILRAGWLLVLPLTMAAAACGGDGADDRTALREDELERLLSDRTKIVAITHMSNALGTINPIARIIELAHGRGIPVLVDGSQAAYHMPVDVRALGVDFYAATGCRSTCRWPGGVSPMWRSSARAARSRRRPRR